MSEDIGLKETFRDKLPEVFQGYEETREHIYGCDMVLIDNITNHKKFIEFKGGNPSNPRWFEEKQYQLAKEKGNDYVIVRWKDNSKQDIIVTEGLDNGFEITKIERKYWFRFK